METDSYVLTSTICLQVICFIKWIWNQWFIFFSQFVYWIAMALIVSYFIPYSCNSGNSDNSGNSGNSGNSSNSGNSGNSGNCLWRTCFCAWCEVVIAKVVFFIWSSSCMLCRYIFFVSDLSWYICCFGCSFPTTWLKPQGPKLYFSYVGPQLLLIMLCP